MVNKLIFTLTFLLFLTYLGTNISVAQSCSSHADCDDGLFCNGAESCVFGVCQTAILPGCIVGICNESTDQCLLEVCSTDIQCDDGIFCNGFERCDPLGSLPNLFGCVAATETFCTEEEQCDEVEKICIDISACVDNDGDGFRSSECGGIDCNDDVVYIHPNATEICDPDGVDEDCDPSTFGPDVDGDGYVSSECCNSNNCGHDCDDTSAVISPEGNEVCNGNDDNCDGQIDEGVMPELYADEDGDGHGNPNITVEACFESAFSSTKPNDCDDTNPAIQPGSMICDDVNDRVVWICNNKGSYESDKCDEPKSSCVSQPNGTGKCQLKKIKK